MNNNSITLIQISPDELKQLITEVLQTVNKPAPNSIVNEYMTRAATAQKLGISLPTLNEYSKCGIIPSYRLGSRIRYKSIEVEAALLKIKSVKGKRA